MMNKRMKGLIFFITICLLVTGTALATQIRPFADSVFNLARPMLYPNKTVTFTANTYDVVGSISVSNCRLEHKVDASGTIMGISVPSPSYVATNTFGYSATEDYSAYITDSDVTYTFYATFTADGHSVTRSSSCAF